MGSLGAQILQYSCPARPLKSPTTFSLFGPQAIMNTEAAKSIALWLTSSIFTSFCLMSFELTSINITNPFPNMPEIEQIVILWSKLKLFNKQECLSVEGVPSV